MKLFLLALAATFLLPLASDCFAQQHPVFTTSALNGDSIDGETIESISLFHNPYILSDGETFFTADLVGGEDAFLSEQQVAIVTGAQLGGAAAGTVIDFMGQAVVNDQAEVTMSAVLGGSAVDSTNDSGIVFYNGTVNMIVQKGDSAPDTSEAFGALGGIRFDDEGDLHFTSALQTSGDHSLYVRRNATTELVQRTGITAPDGFMAQNIAGHTTGKFSIQDNEKIVLTMFFVFSFNPNSQQERTELVKNLPDNSNTVMVATGDTVPGLPAGTTFQDAFVPKLNDNGQIGMFIEFDGASTGRSLSVLEVNGSVTGGRSAAMIGDPAPGMPGFDFASFQNFVINQSGDVALFAEVSPTPGANMGNISTLGGAQIVGVWFEDSSDTLQLAAHNGMQAPGLDTGVTIQQVGFPAYNDLNQVAFKSSLSGPGVEFFVNDEALWATDPNGVLQLVARTGDLFDINDDPNTEDLRTIVDIGTIANSAGTGGESTSFNDTGQLAFTLRFTDATSGVFVANWAATNSPLTGDFNNDGVVNIADYTVWRDNLGGTDDAVINNAGDEVAGVSAGDYAVWKQHFGEVAALTTTFSHQAPEPATAWIALAALCSLAMCSKRTRAH